VHLRTRCCTISQEGEQFFFGDRRTLTPNKEHQRANKNPMQNRGGFDFYLRCARMRSNPIMQTVGPCLLIQV